MYSASVSPGRSVVDILDHRIWEEAQERPALAVLLDRSLRPRDERRRVTAESRS